MSLYNLAETIVDAYGFHFDHCFGFFEKMDAWGYTNSKKGYELFTDLIAEGESLEPTGTGSVKKTTVNEVWQKPTDTMMFLFDYGDMWRFAVKLKSIGEKVPKIRYPRVISKIGRAPKQYGR